jgi:hypothetical protein
MEIVVRVTWIVVLLGFIGGLPVSMRKLLLPHSGYLHTSRNEMQPYNAIIQNTALEKAFRLCVNNQEHKVNDSRCSVADFVPTWELTGPFQKLSPPHSPFS